ncbi:Glycosyl transferase, family 4, conserved region [Segniliparus rotundus DSM 44985]|uniref:Glycosyl transferase, family 4, conserved region n=1 Tax=Segniliparus rotundus (strain ATCC BAA-972 / CDC 1076 / CIP 108378 / DSM 44985 / JCM 13578) TaxID=640132 RepID=D6ZDA8_SEGRD|nr:MraY family glycosyltransferase [Segniliparus rotundus]ADG97172.1 Glycosyl transferase, family 4, conserved region [Segniliparus rotundus DSM 44985]
MYLLGVPYRELALVLLTAAVVTYFLTGAVGAAAVRAGAVHVPRERDMHHVPTPRMGGVAMYTAMVAALLLASQLPALKRGFAYSTDMAAVMVAGGVIVLVGAIDDQFELDWATKLAGQLTAAAVLVLLGLSWEYLYVPFSDVGVVVLDRLQGGLITAGVTVLAINAMNFIDGLDGLAAGLGFIVSAGICLFSIGLLQKQGGDVGSYPPALISAALAGTCLGFLPHNFHPAKIFMGDSGAMLIGLMLAAGATSASGRITQAAFGATDGYVLLAPLLLVVATLFVPFLDVLLAVIRRVRAGQSPFGTTDKLHLHHRMIALGHSHPRAVLVFYLWVWVLTFGVVASTRFPRLAVLALTLAGLLTAALVTGWPKLKRLSGR